MGYSSYPESREDCSPADKSVAEGMENRHLNMGISKCLKIIQKFVDAAELQSLN